MGPSIAAEGGSAPMQFYLGPQGPAAIDLMPFQNFVLKVFLVSLFRSFHSNLLLELIDSIFQHREMDWVLLLDFFAQLYDEIHPVA